MRQTPDPIPVELLRTCVGICDMRRLGPRRVQGTKWESMECLPWWMPRPSAFCMKLKSITASPEAHGWTTRKTNQGLQFLDRKFS